MNEKEKMISGEAYFPYDEELVALRKKARQLCDDFNFAKQSDNVTRAKIIHELLGVSDETTKINTPFHCDYGFNIHVGKNFYANCDCVFLDVTLIKIGDNCMLGPGVHIYTATHPINKDERRSKIEYGKKVVIGDDVWIGGKTTINPGIKIGSNVVIGSGSVVTKNIPDNVVAAGNPCRVIRRI